MKDENSKTFTTQPPDLGLLFIAEEVCKTSVLFVSTDLYTVQRSKPTERPENPLDITFWEFFAFLYYFRCND